LPRLAAWLPGCPPERRAEVAAPGVIAPISDLKLRRDRRFSNGMVQATYDVARHS
jgi:hypothetical protein